MTGEIREYSRRDKRRGNARTRVEIARRGNEDVVLLVSEWDEPHAGARRAPADCPRVSLKSDAGRSAYRFMLLDLPAASVISRRRRHS